MSSSSSSGSGGSVTCSCMLLRQLRRQANEFCTRSVESCFRRCPQHLPIISHINNKMFVYIANYVELVTLAACNLEYVFFFKEKHTLLTYFAVTFDRNSRYCNGLLHILCNLYRMCFYRASSAPMSATANTDN